MQLRDGHDPNSPDEATPVGLFGPGLRSPLHVAVIYGHLTVVAELLAAGIDPNTRDKVIRSWVLLLMHCRERSGQQF